MFRILIVEDSRPYRESLRDILDEGKFPGVIVEEAENCKDAMERGASFCPDLIFMDIGLPDGSGLELTKKIKAMRPQVSVAMLTSHDGPEYREAAIRYGASHFLTKGVVTREEIQNLVRSSLSQVN
jgi:two-component system response regulator YesN